MQNNKIVWTIAKNWEQIFSIPMKMRDMIWKKVWIVYSQNNHPKIIRTWNLDFINWNKIVINWCSIERDRIYMAIELRYAPQMKEEIEKALLRMWLSHKLDLLYNTNYKNMNTLNEMVMKQYLTKNKQKQIAKWVMENKDDKKQIEETVHELNKDLNSINEKLEAMSYAYSTNDVEKIQDLLSQ